MGSFAGVRKGAAAARGMTVAEYEAKLAGGEKWCSFGKHWSLRSEFHKESGRSDGLATYCKPCATQRMRDKLGRMDPTVRKEKGKAAARSWRAANPEKSAAIAARHHGKYADRNNEMGKIRYAADPERYKEMSRRHRALYPEKYILQRARRRAVLRNLDFDLVLEDIVIPATCPVLGIPLTPSSGQGQSDNSPSIDRLDSSRGYVRGNVHIISMKANRIKNDATIEDLKKVLDYMRRTR